MRNWELRRCGRGGRSTRGETRASGDPDGAAGTGTDRPGEAVGTDDTEAIGASGRSAVLSTLGEQPDESSSSQQSMAGDEKTAFSSRGRAQQKSGSARRPPARKKSARATPVRFTFLLSLTYAADDPIP